MSPEPPERRRVRQREVLRQERLQAVETESRTRHPTTMDSTNFRRLTASEAAERPLNSEKPVLASVASGNTPPLGSGCTAAVDLHSD